MLGDSVIAVCDALNQHIKHDFPKNKAPVHTIPNGIDRNKFYPCAAPTTTQPTLGIAGRLTGPKGFMLSLAHGDPRFRPLSRAYCLC